MPLLLGAVTRCLPLPSVVETHTVVKSLHQQVNKSKLVPSCRPQVRTSSHTCPVLQLLLVQEAFVSCTHNRKTKLRIAATLAIFNGLPATALNQKKVFLG